MTSGKQLTASTLQEQGDTARNLNYIVWTLYAFSLILYSGVIHVQRLNISRRVASGYPRRCDSSWYTRSSRVLALWSLRSPVPNLHALVHRCKLGTTPTNDQLVVISLLFLINFLACFVQVNHLTTGSPASYGALAITKGIAMRTGQLAFANTPLVVALTGRHTLLVSLSGIPRKTWILIHRWVGRLIFVMSLVHTLACLVLLDLQRTTSRCSAIALYFRQEYIVAGTVALVGLFVLVSHSIRFLRETWHELFLIIHISAVFVFLLGSYLHERYADDRPAIYMWLFIAFGLMILDYLLRMLSIIALNCPTKASGWRLPKATMNALTDATELVVMIHRHSAFQSGDTVYLSFPLFNVWETHPFTIISLEQVSRTPASVLTYTADTEGCKTLADSMPKTLDMAAPMKTVSEIETKSITTQDLATTPTTIRFLIRARQGMTRKLYNHASRSWVPTTVLLSSVSRPPYFPHERYEELLFIAGGAGITPILPLFTRACHRQTITSTSILLIWVVRDTSMLDILAQSIVDSCEHASAPSLETGLELEAGPRVERMASVGDSSPRVVARYRKVVVYVTDTHPIAVSHTEHPCITVKYGRPDIRTLVHDFTCTESTRAICGAGGSGHHGRRGGATAARKCVVACGPDSLVDAARSSVATYDDNGTSDVSFYEPTF